MACYLAVHQQLPNRDIQPLPDLAILISSGFYTTLHVSAHHLYHHHQIPTLVTALRLSMQSAILLAEDLPVLMPPAIHHRLGATAYA